MGSALRRRRFAGPVNAAAGARRRLLRADVPATHCGKTMIAPSVVQEIRRLLAEGVYSQRSIARITGVSRGTVGAIASGRRRDYGPSPHGRALDESAGPPRRCPGCGGLVSMPCRLCHVRKLVAEARVTRPPERPEAPLRLELSASHRARYEQVRRRPRRRRPPHAGQ
jgi:hypothetical protein